MSFNPGRWLVLAVLLLCGLVPAAAGAQPVPVARLCHATASAGEDWAQVNVQPARWHCRSDGWTLDAEEVLIRFELGDTSGRVLPQSLSMHTGHFERIDVATVGRDGRSRWSSWWPADLHHLAAGPYMTLPLGGVDGDTRLIVVRVVRPWSKTLLSEMRLDAAPDGTGWPLHRIVAMAAICGMLLVPLLINSAFYSVLPERFVIWHLVMVASMLAQAGFATGFVHLVMEQGAGWEWQASNLAFSVMAAAGLMFAASFIEEDRLHPRLRRAAIALAPVVVIVGGISCLPVEPLRTVSSASVYVVIAAAIAVIVAIMADARRRRSRAVRFLVVGWTPIIAIGSYRIASYLVPVLHPTEAITTYQLALAFEVLVNALGIVSRFVEIRQERDMARARALELEGMAEHDPLTGLRNRRTIEGRFEELYRRGFRTMAVLDLDHFKAINDTHGHATGDMVLQAVAGALAEDRDTKAIRMGGEEFLLLLRGGDAASRAERCRRAITTRIAAQVPGLERIVTASMGLVEHDTRGNLQIDFASLYARCDQLLYEAKRLGRNRTMREKVTGFQPPAVSEVA